MTQHTIELPEATYQLLLKQSNRLHLPPERILEQLILGNFALLDSEDNEFDAVALDTSTALAALERLTTLFEDISIPNFDKHLDDPMLELINADLNQRFANTCRDAA